MVGLGALGGVFSAFISEGFKLFTKSSDRKHEIKLLEMQKEIGDKETERAIEVASIDASIRDTESARLHDAKLGENVSRWVGDLRASLRPLVTYLCLFAAIGFYFSGDSIVKTQIVAAFVMLLEAITAFWFTSRALGKRNN